MSPSRTGIKFSNQLTETRDINVFTYDYVYNGAGLAAGDVNSDGLIDLFFAGNTVDNKLYLNKGNFDFKEVSDDAGVEGKKGWKTGVTMADVNGDGLLDIYVCYAGLKDDDRSNELFINKGYDEDGIPKFKEVANEYGLDAAGTYSTQSYFFDFDLDGDLDMFLLNHGLDYKSSYANANVRKEIRHPEYGNRLYKNENGFFTDISEQAGIYGGWLNYGLSASISDFNGDNFPDIYVSNDFDERDYLYLNNGSGTFTDRLKECFSHISKFTMGTDAADFNNDNRVDLVTLDMLPEDNYRQKLLMGPENFDRYNYYLKLGFHRQQMRNMLHFNRGLDENNLPIFSEVGQLSGLSNTDWSWASLFADFDNDGFKDIFITNGYKRDFTNLDFQKYDFEAARKKLFYMKDGLKSEEGKQFMFDLVNKMSPITISNYVFRNTGGMTFSNKTKEWGLYHENLSNGAVYVDLDNDGDLDLVVNNLNERADIFRNNSEKLNGNHYLRINLIGDKKNTLALGSKIYLKSEKGEQFLESNFNRGFLSSVDNTLHFGLGKDEKVNELRVVWPDKKVSILRNFRADTTLQVDYKAAQFVSESSANIEKTHFVDLTDSIKLNYSHQENSFIDYKQERLLLCKLSHQGPKVSVADVNKDGLDDLFIGGACGQAGSLFIQNKNETFQVSNSQPWLNDKSCEDVASLFFDADNDGDSDLYVVSGGNEFQVDSKDYQDRLYINNGKGIFSMAKDAIPNRLGGGSCITSADFDKDGDLDLFVGGWTLPGAYPKCSASRILRNESTKNKPVFKDITSEICPELATVGVLHDAKWTDYDNDGRIDLIVTGDWMPISIFRNQNPKFVNVTQQAGLGKTNGFWTVINAGDYDNDGDIDYAVGNLGLNSELKASVKEPLKMYVDDFDKDGKIDPVICSYIQGVSYPLATRDELLSQILPLRKKFIRYAQYADVTIDKILDSTQLKNCDKKEIYQLRSCYLENKGNTFVVKPLPLEVQFAPVQALVRDDFNNDGHQDILMGGNFFEYRAEYGPFDASIGLLMFGDGGGNFKPVDRKESGVLIRGDVRDIARVKTKSRELFVVTKNNGPVQILGTVK